MLNKEEIYIDHLLLLDRRNLGCCNEINI